MVFAVSHRTETTIDLEVCSVATGAVIAAAGMSSRMGKFKPMLSIGAISIAQRIVATFQQAGVSRIVVVTGYRAEELEWHLARSGVEFLYNENYADTQMFDSAVLGFKYLSGKCSNVLFTPVDIPLFTSTTVEALLNSDAELACPVYAGKRGHPILLSSAVMESILSDSGEKGLQGAIDRCGVPITEVEVVDPGILLDADTPEDYAELLETHNRQLFRPVIEVSIAREKKFLDARVAMLLQLTDETYSVRQACKHMQLSYSSGWNAINLLERELGYAVVERSQGGSRTGRSHLTAKGRALLKAYSTFSALLQDEAEKLYGRCFGNI